MKTWAGAGLASVWGYQTEAAIARLPQVVGLPGVCSHLAGGGSLVALRGANVAPRGLAADGEKREGVVAVRFVVCVVVEELQGGTRGSSRLSPAHAVHFDQHGRLRARRGLPSLRGVPVEENEAQGEIWEWVKSNTAVYINANKHISSDSANKSK